MFLSLSTWNLFLKIHSPVLECSTFGDSEITFPLCERDFTWELLAHCPWLVFSIPTPVRPCEPRMEKVHHAACCCACYWRTPPQLWLHDPGWNQSFGKGQASLGTWQPNLGAWRFPVFHWCNTSGAWCRTSLRSWTRKRRIEAFRFAWPMVRHWNIEGAWRSTLGDFGRFWTGLAFEGSVLATFTVLARLEVLPIWLILCLGGFLSRRTCTAFAFCGTTHLNTKPWPAKRIENKAAKSHVAQKNVFDRFW